VEIQLHAVLASALDAGERSALRPGRFAPGERGPNVYLIGGWVGPRAGVNAMVKRKNSSPSRVLNPGLPVPPQGTDCESPPYYRRSVVMLQPSVWKQTEQSGGTTSSDSI